MKEQLTQLMNGKTFTESEAERIMFEMMNGQVPETQMASLLSIMRFRGESVEELTGFTRAMRAKAKEVCLDYPELLDTCGTGGDQSATFNISTASAIGLSASGVAVAKHGNRSVSSKSGSADVLEALQMPVIHEPEQLNGQLEQSNLAFLYAPLYHSAMKHVSKTRQELGFKTIFNLLGPLTNPANACYQVIGVFDANYGMKMAEVLKRLGTKRALFVTGEDGVDEITITGKTTVTELHNGNIRSYDIEPEMFGFKRHPLSSIQVDSIAESAALIRNVFKGSGHEAARSVLVMNMAAGLYVSGKSETLIEGATIAEKCLKDGTIDNHFHQLTKKAGETYAS
ncbi:LOW QUALITY PROTEIN: anthranilate phosphoribosyltransferase [Geomicrobium sp. JCM 19039]|nr:LOW QUALITY PROTEIN: anthranilate phosphoribosyltransferase [Geomicrobium sp. JCM 19039]